MLAKAISPELALKQVSVSDVKTIAELGFKSIVCNRPDSEGSDQPTFEEIRATAEVLGLEVRYQPVSPGMVTDENVADFEAALSELPKPALAYCRTGIRFATLWSLSQASKKSLPDIVAAARSVGYDMAGVVRRLANGGKTPTDTADASFDVVIVGAGAAGIATAASLLKRKNDLEIAIIDPADIHYYQPGWTMVGGGIFAAKSTAKSMASFMPSGVKWIKAAVAAFEPAKNVIVLDGCRVVKYEGLIVSGTQAQLASGRRAE